MKKIILLASVLIISLQAISQSECYGNITDATQICKDGQLCLNISFFAENADNIYPMYLNIASEMGGIFSYEIPDQFLTSINGICGFTEGETLELYITDISQNRCNESTKFVTIVACNTLDNDSDGYFADVDCNDLDNTIYPGAPEICDNKDNDCNGSIDEGLERKTYYWDADLDGYGNPNLIAPNRCVHPGGRYVELAGDCNDSDPSINPDAEEICGNAIDENCNGMDDDVCQCSDSDGDTVCDEDDICPGFDDLADTDNDTVPDACDACQGNDASGDTDADGVCDDLDLCPLDSSNDSDGDGVCDSNDICPGFDDNIDTDGDGIPDNCDNCSSIANPNQEPDADCDGTPDDLDCDDNNPNVPTANETCGDGIDNNCDGNIDEDCETCPDADGDTVCDAVDICPGTDDLLDTDNDGTPDCLDQCPNDRNKIESGDCGCNEMETDRDGDGVTDCNDLELNSPCTIVDDNGISIDSDGDGVPNCEDLCEGSDDNIDLDKDRIPDGCDENTYCRGDKIVICHINNKGETTTTCISPNQWQRHLDHGDTLGACNSVARQATQLEDVIISPNPTTGKFSIILNSKTMLSNALTITIKNSYGIEVYGSTHSNSKYIELNIQDRLKEIGMYFLFITDGNSTITKKLIVSK